MYKHLILNGIFGYIQHLDDRDLEAAKCYVTPLPPHNDGSWLPVLNWSCCGSPEPWQSSRSSLRHQHGCPERRHMTGPCPQRLLAPCILGVGLIDLKARTFDTQQAFGRDEELRESSEACYDDG